MALVVKDRVKETTSTTGTGTLTLGGAVTGFQTFTSVLSNGDTTYYAIFESSTGEFEVGLGTFTSSGTTLARTTVLESSNSGNAINLTAGAADVFITQPAEKAVYLDASGHIATADGRNVTNVAASTAATLATARTIGGVSFDGSANINLPGVNTAGNQDTSGNAATATTAGTVTTAAQPNITSLGTLTTLTVDDITINGSTISDAGNLTVDVGGDIILDSATGYVKFLDTGTLEYGRVYESSNRLVIQSMVSDADLLFSGVDGGVGFTALTLDMSDAGSAVFNNHVYISDNSKLIFGASSDLQIYHDTSHSIIQEAGTGALKVKGDDIRLEDASGNNIIKAVGSGSAELYEAGNKKLETTTTGISVTGNIAVSGTVDGIDIAGNINQAVKTTSSPQFANVYINDYIYHHADADTWIRFDTDEIVLSGGGLSTYVNSQGLFIADGSLAEDYDALSGTTPTCNVDNAGAFSLTTSGNTTFTFSGASSGYAQGFVLQVTAGGTHTLTWPASVDWAGGSAPDAPASGASNLYVFYTRDGGTNWIGILSAAAYA